MGIKLTWVGLTLTVISPIFGLGRVFSIAGAIIMAIGVVLICLDK